MTKNSKSFTKFLATATTVSIVGGAIAPMAFAANFEDVAPQYKDAVDFVASKGITGFNETTFGTYENIKRVDAAVMLVKVLGLDIESAPASGFTDVPARAVKEINALKAAGITQGKTTTTFASQDLITRGELAVWIQKGFELLGDGNTATFTDVPPQYKNAISALVSNDITKGTSNVEFGTYNKAKRGDFAKFLHKAYQVKDVEFESGISGFILNGDNPVVGANVKIDGHTATTNEAGYYNIKDVKPGKHSVTIEAKGYKTVTVSDVAVLDEKMTSFTQNIAEKLIDTNQIEVSGVVVNAKTGAAITTANVTLDSYDEKTDAWTTVAVGNTESGKYTINQTAANPDLKLGGEYRLTVTANDHKDYVQTITLDNQEVKNVLAGIQLEPIAPMTIDGTVTNAAGNKVAGASVTIKNAEGIEVATATTDANGAYKVENKKLVTGTYNVVINDTTSALSYSEFQVTEGTNATHNVQLEAGNTITASIGTDAVNGVFGTGAADTATYKLEILKGNTVIATDEFTSEANKSDSTLTFDFSRIAPGDYTLRLSGSHIVTKDYPNFKVDGNESFEGRAVAAGTISGIITDTNGAKLEKATVNAIDTNGKVVSTVETDQNGAYTFTGLSAGKYTMKASKANFVSETTNEVTVTQNGTVDAGTMDLADVPTTGNVTGHVRTTGTLAPVAGATVTYYDTKGEEVEKATVDANGAYSISNVEAGSYKVVVRGSGIETYTTTQQVSGGENLTSVNYSLTSGGNASLEITVVDSEGNAVDVADNGFDLADLFVDPTNPTVGTWEVSESKKGTATLTGLSAGTYNLAIDAESSDFVDVKTTATVGTGEKAKLQITVEEVAAQNTVNFRVIDEKNSNVEDATVVIFNEDGSMKEVLSTTNAGTAALELIDGTYTLAVYKNGYIVSENELVVAGKEVTVPVIQLVPAK